MILTFLFYLLLLTLSTPYANKKSLLPENSDEYQVAIGETQNYDLNPQLNDFKKPSTFFIVVIVIICIIFVIIVALSIRACCNRSKMKVSKASANNSNDESGVNPYYIDQQIYQQNLQQQYLVQQQVLQQHNYQQQQIYQNNLQQQQQFYQQYH